MLDKSMGLSIEAFGERFNIVHVAKSTDEANEYCSQNPGSGVIATDQEVGLVFIADRNPIDIECPHCGSSAPRDRFGACSRCGLQRNADMDDEIRMFRAQFNELCIEAKEDNNNEYKNQLRKLFRFMFREVV